jgi:RNA polymerase sigma-70 factor, ECF subfamily
MSGAYALSLPWQAMTTAGGDNAPSAADAAAPDPDLALVRRAGRGDRDACTALVDRYLARVHGIALRLLGQRADAEDIAQEVFLRVWQQASQWREGEARFGTWIYRITQNLCMDRLRGRRTADADGLATLADPGAAAGETLERHDTAAAVRAAVQTLPERQREAVVLCHFGELGNIEAAAVLGLSVDALESLLARGRRALRERLAQENSIPGISGT